jgi:hypothetical protein
LRQLAVRLRDPLALKKENTKMKATDVLARAELVLGIEQEPPVHPIVAPPKAGQPAAPGLDRAKVADVLERARIASRPPPTPEPVQPPQMVKRRVEIMVTGGISRVGMVRNALQDLQARLFQEVGNDNLELRVTAFLDGCRHTTPWSRSPIDAGASTNRWHCFQGGTRYAEAFGYTAKEIDPVDAIIMFGGRFDDDLWQSLEIAERLRRQGTRIYAFHVRGNSRTRHAYEQLAERTGGAFVQLSNHQAFARVMPVIVDYLMRAAEALRARPASRDIKNWRRANSWPW